MIAVTGLQEVQDRRYETGIFIAMGVSHYYLVALYLIKVLLIAALASVAGFLLGSSLAVQFAAPFLIVNTQPVTFVWSHLPLAMGISAAVAVLAEVLPVVKLLTLDPNVILAEQ